MAMVAQAVVGRQPATGGQTERFEADAVGTRAASGGDKKFVGDDRSRGGVELDAPRRTPHLLCLRFQRFAPVEDRGDPRVTRRR
jgi:hypothetical protein